MTDKSIVLPKILTIALALIVLLGGVAFGQMNARLNRGERLLDGIIPILYRIEQRTDSNGEQIKQLRQLVEALLQ